MSRLRRGALFVIVVAVLAMIQRSGELNPWVYLVIGITWGAYAGLKKATTLDAVSGLFCETAMLSVALGISLSMSVTVLRLPHSLPNSTLLVLALCGVISVLPLCLFSFAAARLPLSVVGFFQFVLPTTQLVVALTFYRQPVSFNSLLCFCVIWASLAAIILEPLLVRASRLQIKESA